MPFIWAKLKGRPLGAGWNWGGGARLSTGHIGAEMGRPVPCLSGPGTEAAETKPHEAVSAPPGPPPQHRPGRAQWAVPLGRGVSSLGTWSPSSQNSSNQTGHRHFPPGSLGILPIRTFQLATELQGILLLGSFKENYTNIRLLLISQFGPHQKKAGSLKGNFEGACVQSRQKAGAVGPRRPTAGSLHLCSTFRLCSSLNKTDQQWPRTQR